MQHVVYQRPRIGNGWPVFGSSPSLILAALLMLLLLAQPLLCVIHCQMSHHGYLAAASLDKDQSHFLCDTPADVASDGLFIPAFWPGLPVALVGAIVALVVVIPLISARSALIIVPACAPLTPPPR